MSHCDTCGRWGNFETWPEDEQRICFPCCHKERERARAAARRLYHDWDARSVRAMQELAEREPWILVR